MYFFDLEDYATTYRIGTTEINGFDCNSIPKDWEDYLSQYRSESGRFIKCFYELYKQKQFEYLGGNNEGLAPNTDPCWDNIQLKYILFETLFNEMLIKMNVLITALAAATPYQPETFDISLYYSYIDTYNRMMDESKKLILMLNTRCTIMGVENNVGVDTQTLGTKTINKCTGVYMKQMDNGSEFIGKITSSSTVTPTFTRSLYE
jgi:hypothetical protein